MSIHDCRLKQLLQPIYHTRTPHPIVMIPRQPALRLLRQMVLFHVVLVRREDEGSVVFQVHLHDAKAWSVPGRVVKCDTLCKIEVDFIKRGPVEFG